MNNEKTISIIVPCFNEEEAVLIFYKEFLNILKKIISKYWIELIFVDDGSKDNTLSSIKSISAKDYKVKYISFSRNFGKEAAIYAGLKKSSGNYVAVMDVDLQDPPELLIKMIEMLEENENIDCVATKRKTRTGEPKVRSFLSETFYKIINKVSSTEIVNGARDFRLMRRKMVDAILLLSEKNRFSKGVFSWVGFNTEWIAYDNVERVAGQTKWSFTKLFKYAIEGIISFSDFLLFVPYIYSLVALLLGIFMIVPAVLSLNSFVWTILSVCFLLSSIFSFFLGNIGLYISKINSEVKNRPIYIVKEEN